MAWDEASLTFAARVWDDELAATKPGQRWGSFWSHDGIVLLVHALPDKELTVGFNYHSPGCPARELPGGARYAVRPAKDGYAVQATVPFAALGITPRVGQRLRFMLIPVDIDPSAPGGERFQQYLWNTRGGDARRWGELRLVGDDGWGSDLTPERDGHAGDQPLRYIGVVDVFGKDVALQAIEIIEAASGAVVKRMPIGLKLAAGHRYRLRGAIPPPILATGKLKLRLSAR
jgi:hypothetical protein